MCIIWEEHSEASVSKNYSARFNVGRGPQLYNIPHGAQLETQVAPAKATDISRVASCHCPTCACRFLNLPAV